MPFLQKIYEIIIDALFPLSPTEQELLSFTPEQAYTTLPPAPPTPLSNTLSIFAYKDERVAKLVWNIKYKKSFKAVELGAYALYMKLLEMNVAPGTIVVPIPITRQRRRERGFNQCELLLDEIQKLDVARHFTCRKDILVRTRHASRQTLKGRAERLQSAQGIFSVENVGTVAPNSTIVVIDDVITTGSTVSEALITLRTGMPVHVLALSIAH